MLLITSHLQRHNGEKSLKRLTNSWFGELMSLGEFARIASFFVSLEAKP